MNLTESTESTVAVATALPLCPSLTQEGRQRRTQRLAVAAELGADEAALRALASALRVSRSTEITVPAHRYEGLSRGRGWARRGRGARAAWGERADGGYRVGPGRWTVGGSDGYARQGEVVWDVAHVQVGSETWTVAS